MRLRNDVRLKHVKHLTRPLTDYKPAPIRTLFNSQMQLKIVSNIIRVRFPSTTGCPHRVPHKGSKFCVKLLKLLHKPIVNKRKIGTKATKYNNMVMWFVRAWLCSLKPNDRTEMFSEHIDSMEPTPLRLGLDCFVRLRLNFI